MVPRDRYHSDAVTIMANCRHLRFPLVTSNFVAAETHALILSKSGIAPASQFIRSFESTGIELLRAEPQDEETARQIIFTYDDKRFSMVDAISFAMMHRFGIDRAFAFDRNFTQFGLRLLQP